MPETVLITGASGFLGRHLQPALTAAGHKVYSHSSRDSDIARELPDYADVTHVFHLAGRTFVPDSWQETPAFYEVNVQGTVNVMELCRRRGASITVLSSYVYGVPRHLPIDENHPLAAVNPYAHTKILAEEIARFYAAQFGLRVCIIRPFNLYGRGQDPRFLIPEVIRAAIDTTIPVIEVADLSPRRDYLHVEDLVRLLIVVMASGRTGTFNAGYGSSFSVQDIVALVNECLPAAKPIVNRNESRANEISDVVADISLATKTFGWTPYIPLREGLRLLIEEAKGGTPATGTGVA
jgi:nucleoside-diphosphate-sugar epimerase